MAGREAGFLDVWGNLTSTAKVEEQESTPGNGSYVWSDEIKQRVAVVGIIMVCTIVGNTFMILMLMCKKSRRRKRVNIFLTNLAIGDLGVALVTNTTEILFLVFDDWTLGPAACKIIVYLQIVTLASATFLLTAMSIDRYQVIVKPMQSLANRPRIWLKVAIAWTMAFIFATPQLSIFVLKEKGFKYDGTPRRVCASKGYTAEWQRKLYMTFMTAYILIVPTIVMLFCYSKIIRVVWTRARSDGPRTECSSTDETSGSPRISVRKGLVTASKRRAVVMTLTVIIGFLVCLTPYFIVSLVRIYSDYKIRLDTSLAVAENIFMTHSSLNPILYGLFTMRIHHFRWLCKCFKCATKTRRKSSERNRLLNGGACTKKIAKRTRFKLQVTNDWPSEPRREGVFQNTHAVSKNWKQKPQTVISDRVPWLSCGQNTENANSREPNFGNQTMNVQITGTGIEHVHNTDSASAKDKNKDTVLLLNIDKVDNVRNECGYDHEQPESNSVNLSRPKSSGVQAKSQQGISYWTPCKEKFPKDGQTQV